MQNQNSSPFDWGNSLIGNIALIKDMIPQMQVNSTNAGTFHTYRVAPSQGMGGETLKVRGGTKYLVDNNDCSFYAPELIFRDTTLIFCMNIPNNAR